MQLCEETSDAQVWTTPIQLFFIGFVLSLIGFIFLITSKALQDDSVSGGLIFFVGPVPIILGSGPLGFFSILLAIILTIIGFIVFLLLCKQALRSMVKQACLLA
jgi:uncharacterized membrane protein